MKTVKVVRVRAFEASMAEVAKADVDRDAYLTSDVRPLIPEAPKPLELRGPSWSAIARGAALPNPANARTEGSPMTPPTPPPHPRPADEGTPPLEEGAVVDYAGMKGTVLETRNGPPHLYYVGFPNGARTWLSDRDLAK